jgi:hypothetical protein
MVYIAVNASFPIVLCLVAGIYDSLVVDRDSNSLAFAAGLGMPPLVLWSVFVLARFTRHRGADALYRRSQAMVAGWVAAGVAALIWVIVSVVASEVSTAKFKLEILGAILAVPAAVLFGLGFDRCQPGGLSDPATVSRDSRRSDARDGRLSGQSGTLVGAGSSAGRESGECRTTSAGEVKRRRARDTPGLQQCHGYG